MAKWNLLATLALVIIALFLCSGIFTNYAGNASFQTKKAGPIVGFLHGIIAPIMLIISLFIDYKIYEINNWGWIYDFGFILGILLIWGSGGKSTSHIVKNYYHSRENKEKSHLQEEDISKISKIVEEKISKSKKIKEKPIIKKPENTKLKETEVTNIKLKK